MGVVLARGCVKVANADRSRSKRRRRHAGIENRRSRRYGQKIEKIDQINKAA